MKKLRIALLILISFGGLVFLLVSGIDSMLGRIHYERKVSPLLINPNQKKSESHFSCSMPVKFKWQKDLAELGLDGDKFICPTNGKVSSTFRYRPQFGRFHYGLDIAASRGTSVFSSAAGYVTRACWAGGYGLFVEIQHAEGYKTRYGHLNDVMVRKGEYVSQNELIGRVGNTGHSTGNHLHFEILKDGVNLNPQYFVSGE